VYSSKCKTNTSSYPGLISWCSRFGTFCLEKVIIAASGGTVVKMFAGSTGIHLSYIISYKVFLVII
jgi:hypothetical protein